MGHNIHEVYSNNMHLPLIHTFIQMPPSPSPVFLVLLRLSHSPWGFSKPSVASSSPLISPPEPLDDPSVSLGVWEQIMCKDLFSSVATEPLKLLQPSGQVLSKGRKY